MYNILPILRNFQELQDQKAKGLYTEEIFPASKSPFILLGEDNGDTTTFALSKGENADQALRNKAIKNLNGIKVDMDIQEVEGFKIALCQHKYAAEKILDKPFLEKVSHELGSESLVIGIPIIGFFAAIAKGKGEANLYNAVVNQYNNASTYPLANTLFYVVRGVIQMIGTTSYSAVVKTEESFLEVTGENDDKGKVTYNAKVGHLTEEGVLNNIQTAFQQNVPIF